MVVPVVPLRRRPALRFPQRCPPLRVPGPGLVAVVCQQLVPAAAVGLATATAVAAGVRGRVRRPGGVPPCHHVSLTVGRRPDQLGPLVFESCHQPTYPLHRSPSWPHPGCAVVSASSDGSSHRGCHTWPPSPLETAKLFGAERHLALIKTFPPGSWLFLTHDIDASLSWKPWRGLLSFCHQCGTSIITCANACDYDRQRCILIQIKS